MFSRLAGVALMSNPFTITVWSRCCGRLNSETPISRNWFLPGGGAVFGTSAAGGALAELGIGSVALASVQAFGAVSFRQPVTLTMSIFCGAGAVCSRSSRSTTSIGMARIIAKVTAREGTQSPQSTQRKPITLRVPQGSTQRKARTLRARRTLRSIALGGGLLLAAAHAQAHDLERTQVLLTFASDGSFV